jgi:hypothetical protein
VPQKCPTEDDNIVPNPIFAKNLYFMEAQQSTAKYWVYFFFWLALMIALLIFYRQWFWLALPGTCTYFAKGMNIM